MRRAGPALQSREKAEARAAQGPAAGLHCGECALLFAHLAEEGEAEVLAGRVALQPLVELVIGAVQPGGGGSGRRRHAGLQ